MWRWTIRSREGKAGKGSPLAAVAVTLGSLLIVATCSTAREHIVPPPPPPPPDPPGASAPPPEENAAPPMPAEAAPAAALEPEVAAPEGPPPPGHELDHFFAALRELEKHTRKEHVRAIWLGDSHGASDLWSGPLRAALQARFGDGGPGFLHVGYKAYRHEGMRIEVKGHWATEPRGPSTAVHTGDGVFGLGGVLLGGSSDSPFAALTVTDPAMPPALTWDLCYKPTAPHDELTITLSGAPERVIKPGRGELLETLRHVALTSTGASPTLKVKPSGGQPWLCGVTIETDPKTQPGVVLDTLGINGARLTTPLAWDEAAWVAELARRPPLLVVVEYGTNEASDHTIAADRYVDNLRKVMARVHKASPDCDCLVLAPTDRNDTPERTPMVRDALRKAAQGSGCRFWDTYEVMGGQGSIARWRNESPPRAGPDGVHLHPRGYKYLGDQLAKDVLAGYQP